MAEPTMLDEATLGEIRGLALHMLTNGQQGAAPPWIGQLNDSRLLLCPPWELDGCYPNLPPADRAEWARRVKLVVAAQQQAEIMVAQRQRAGAGLYVPQ